MYQNFCVFKTANNFYIYDVGCNKFTQISKSFFEALLNKEKDIETSEEFILLKQDGFFLNEIEIVEHPVTDVLPELMDRQMQVMVLQVTQGCNLRCQYCPYSQGNGLTRTHSEKVMKWETAKKAIDLICNHSVDSKYVTLNFYGGEPLLNFNLIKRSVNYIKKQLYGKDLNFGITTNATLLTDEIMQFMASNNFTLVISIDGDKISNDKNRKFANANSGSVYDTVMKKVEIIHEKYESLFKKLSLNMVLDPAIDYSEYENLVKCYPYLKDVNIDVVVKDDSYSDVKDIWNDSFSEKYYYKIFLGYLRSIFGYHFKKELQYFASVSHTFDADVFTLQAKNSILYMNKHVTPSGMCMLGHDKIFVNVKGDLYPCERVNETNESIKLGSIDSGFDIEKVKKVLNYHTNFQGRCKTCIAVRECGMCLHNFGVSGIEDYDLSSVVCKKNQQEFIEKLRRRATLDEAKQLLSKINNGGISNENEF